MIRAFRDLRIDLKRFPIVVRLAGVNDVEAKRLFSEAGVEYYGDDITMEDAARIIVDKMRRAYPGEAN
jgi:succinyl-CoA synthetase beta subunit/citryl-CoA synthetase large subunit